jgi:muramoyltetrapeptide carboxypeptidase
VVAPSHPFFPDKLEAGLDVLRSWGLVPVLMPHVHARHRYTAGTRTQRQADLRAALFEPGFDGVWYARGGSGSIHLVDRLPLEALDQRPVFGFSDATTLLSTLWNHRAGRPVHAPVLHTLGTSNCESTLAATRALLFDGPTERFWAGAPVAGPDRTVEGPVVGGNLCVLASLCGTAHQLDASGCILVLEEVGEAAYKVDRMLTQLRSSGGLAGVRGVVLGDFTGTRIPDEADWAVEDVVAECLDGLDLPIVTGMPVGHGTRNHPFMVGEPGRLSGQGLWLSEGG